jgi:hypothetical protein
LTGWLALFLAFSALLLNGALWLSTPAPYKETVLEHTWETLRWQGSDDSWGVMAKALKHARPAEGAPPLYEQVFFKQKHKFQYPPTSLFTLMGMQWLAGPERVRIDDETDFAPFAFNDLMGWLFLLATAVSAAALLEIELRRGGLRDGSRIMTAARAALVFGAVLTFYPIVKAFTLGQIQLWLDGMFALALLCWATGRKAGSGFLIGLMCLIKPQYGLLLLWALVRREWRFVAGCAGIVAVGAAASVAVFGWANHVDYLRVLMVLSQHGETYYPNQSVNGLLNRLMSLADPAGYVNLEFQFVFPPFNIWIYGGTLLASLVIVSAALLPRGTAGDPDRTIDLCTIALSTTMASPIAWEHHYGILFPVFAVLLARSLGSRQRLLWLVACYVLISNYIPVTNLLAGTVFNVAQSYVFAAAIVLLVMMHSARPGPRLVGNAPLASLAR